MRQTGSLKLLVLCLACMAIVACTREARNGGADGAAAESQRIVSFSPALTRIAADLGVAGNIVGRTPWCTAVDESVPVVGDLNDIDYEMLTRLRPTNIFIQPPQGGVPAELESLANERGWTITSTHIDSVAEIVDALDAVADALGLDEGGQSGPPRRLAQLRIQLRQLLHGGDEQSPSEVSIGPVLLLYMTDPPAVFGAGTYLDDVLNHLGYANATEARGWAQLTLEDVTRINPAAILFIQPGAPADVDVMDALGAIGKLNIDAVREGRIAVIRHPDALLPSTSVIEMAKEMRAAMEGWR